MASNKKKNMKEKYTNYRMQYSKFSKLYETIENYF